MAPVPCTTLELVAYWVGGFIYAADLKQYLKMMERKTKKDPLE